MRKPSGGLHEHVRLHHRRSRRVAGEPIARAVRLARLALREADPNNSTWLAYSLYAHPNAKAQPA